MQPQRVNGYTFAKNVKETIEQWGAPPDGATFHVADRVIIYSLVTIDPAAPVPTEIKFFTSASQNAALSTDIFPINGKALDIWGVRIDHCVKLNLSDPGLANEQQQAWENTSRLSIRYRNRSGILDSPISELQNHMNFLDGNDVVAAPRPGITSFLMLKNPIQYGSSQEIEFKLTCASGQVTEALNAASTPSLPGGVGSKYWVKLSLLTTQISGM